MKAKVRGTGEIIDVKPRGTSTTIHMSCSEFVSRDGRVFPSVYLDIISDIDWEQRRYEIAKDMLAAFMSNSNSNAFGGSKGNQARDAVEYADALIDELKKHREL